MLYPFLKGSWKNIKSNLFYSSITIFGLAVGLAVGVMVLLWVQDEMSYDRFHKKVSNIYRVGIDGGGTGDRKQIFSWIIAPVTTYAKNELPDVVDGVRIMNYGASPVFTYKDKKFKEDNMVAMTDPSFFTMFDFPLVRGNRANPFPDVYSVVLTETVARKFFGSDDPVGKVISSDGRVNFTVTGVIKDFPSNSSIRFSMLLPLALYNKMQYIDNATSYNGTNRITSIDQDWSNFSYEVYLQLRPGADVEKLKKNLRSIHERQKPSDAPVPYLAQPMADMHLTTIDGEDAGKSAANIFSIVSALILLIACINYINLSTARCVTRSKEISLRKIAGANRWQLFIQLLVETSILFVIAAVIALGIIYLVMPIYNEFSGKQLSLLLDNRNVWLTITATFLLTLVLSSIYPAILLSSFSPLQSLRGKIPAMAGNNTLRKSLIVVQFAFSFLLISGTLIINRQLQYISKKNPGYNRENVLLIRLPHLDKHYDAIRAELTKDPSVADVTRSGNNIVLSNGWTGDNDYDGKDPKTTLYIHPMEIDEHFLDFYGISIKDGKNFTGSRSDSAHFILNETAVREMKLDNPVGKRLRIQQTAGTIIGVVADFHYMSMRKKIEPAVFVYNPAYSWHLSVKAKPGYASQAVASTKKVVQQFSADVPFEYTFLDDKFNSLYQKEQRTGALFTFFAVVAILISCLGLFGLATYTAHVRKREVGIRKVLGASAMRIVRTFSKEYVALVIIAIIIAAPFSWYAASIWLQDFAYRINIPIGAFLIAAIASLGIALLTVSVRTIQAALANPVRSIKAE